MNHLFAEINHYVSSDDFYYKVKEQIQQAPEGKPDFCIGTIDIDRFNYINDLLGFEKGDLILRGLAKHFADLLKGTEFFTRLHADIFAICLDTTELEQVTNRFGKLSQCQSLLDDVLPSSYQFTTSCGIVLVENIPPSVSVVLDKANYARQKAKNNDSPFRLYDDQIDEELQWQKNVTFSMESALRNREFEMYLQPKISIKNDAVSGAEALVRWNHPKLGLVPPNRFIPVMEQSGFIQKLDFFMLEEACGFLKRCGGIGLPLMPISVNFSKAHLSNKDLVEDIFYVVHQAGIATGMIEIEFTESIFIEGFERLVEIVTDLKLLGFRVSLDDFGSAYSSLNCLKELPIDIIKIDKGFLDFSANTEKGKLIIAKIMELIKSLRMLAIMEGVETSDQVDFLRKLSCDFAQGYFFAKPMPIDDYLIYLADHNILPGTIVDTLYPLQTQDKEDLYTIPGEFQMDNWELYILGKNIDMGLMKGYLDGEATVQYVNDRALEYLGYTRHEFREIFHNSIVAFTHPEDAEIVRKNAEELIRTGLPLQFQIRAIRKDGKIIILQGRSSCVVDSRGRPIGLYAFQDVTEELTKVDQLQVSLTNKIKELETTIRSERAMREALHLSEERYRVIVEQSNDIMFDWDFSTDVVTFSEKYAGMFGQMSVYHNPRTNPDARRRIHPLDLAAFEQWIHHTYHIGGRQQVEFRCLAGEGYIWMRCYSTMIRDSKGTPLRAVGLLSNINAQKKELDALTFKSQRDPLTKALNKEELQLQIQALLEHEPDKCGAFVMLDIDNFKTLNDHLGHQMGDSILIEMVHKMVRVLPKGSLVGRMGGDEFGAYLHQVSHEEISVYAQKLVDTLRSNYYGTVEKYSISTSIGICRYPNCGKNFEELYYRADIALYESKRFGKDQYTIYKKGMTGELLNNRTPVEGSEGFLNTYFQEDLPFKILDMLYETKDIHATLSMILKMLGGRFSLDRVYIYQYDLSTYRIHNTYEWCATGILYDRPKIRQFTQEQFQTYLSQYTQEGLFRCDDIQDAPESIFAHGTLQGVKSMLHASLYHDGEPMGLIGFELNREYRHWSGEEMGILGYISRILSVFLMNDGVFQQLNLSSQPDLIPQ